MYVLSICIFTFTLIILKVNIMHFLNANILEMVKNRQTLLLPSNSVIFLLAYLQF